MDDKNTYRDKLQASLDQWHAEIDKLQTKATEAGADARKEYEEQVGKLRDQQHDARKKLKALDDASGAAWKDLRSGFEKAWDDLERGIKKAKERFG